MACADGAAEALRGFHVARKLDVEWGPSPSKASVLTTLHAAIFHLHHAPWGQRWAGSSSFFFFFFPNNRGQRGEVAQGHVQWLVEHSVPGCMVGMGACIQMAGVGGCPGFRVVCSAPKCASSLCGSLSSVWLGGSRSPDVSHPSPVLGSKHLEVLLCGFLHSFMP